MVSIPFALDQRRSPVQLGGPFDFCAFASLSELLLGSLEFALKCTRPRQRFMYVVGRYSMTEAGGCQEGELDLQPQATLQTAKILMKIIAYFQ
jgi:hypothetical protein